MSVSTLVGTPDPDHTTELPSPASCTCIFTATTSGMFGMNMRVDGVMDPHCPRHRRPTMPQKRPLLHQVASMVDTARSFSPRLKLA